MNHRTLVGGGKQGGTFSENCSVEEKIILLTGNWQGIRLVISPRVL